MSRTINSFLKEIAEARNLEYVSLSSGFVQILKERNASKSVDAVKKVSDSIPRTLYVYGSSFHNEYGAQNICDDKTALSAVLSHNKIYNVPHYLIFGPQFLYSPSTTKRKDEGTMPGLIRALKKYARYGLVIKQKNGTQGLEIFRVNNQIELETAWLNMLSRHKDFAYGPFIPLKDEWRLVIIDYQLKLCYRKVRKNPEVEWRHNLSKGAAVDRNVPETFVTEKLLPLALTAVKTLGIRFASVDIVMPTDEVLGTELAGFFNKDNLSILEVNCGIMLTGFLKRFPQDRQLCYDIYDSIVSSYFD